MTKHCPHCNEEFGYLERKKHLYGYCINVFDINEEETEKDMKNLPEGMIADRDNAVYYDTEKAQFYIIKWEDGGNNDITVRYYIK